MDALIDLMKVCAILIASAVIGNWFLMEVKASKRRGAPWYTPYLSIPGIIVIGFTVLVPIILWIMHS